MPQRMMDPRPFTGRRLTLLALGAALIVLLFGFLAEQVVSVGPLVAFDHTFNLDLNALRTPGGVQPFSWIANFGSTATATALCLVLSAFLWAYRRRSDVCRFG